MAYHTEPFALAGGAAPHDLRRRALFRETLADRAERWALAIAYNLMPKRIGGLPSLARLCATECLAPDHALPDPRHARDNPPGLAGIAHDFDLPTVVEGFRRGLYPLAHMGPMKWWSPPNRSILDFRNLHIAKRLRRQIRQGQYTVTFDRDIEGVLTACAGRRSGRWHLTWLTPRVMHVFAEAFDAGLVHSFEVWNDKGGLAGGGYGIALGGMFVTESQFSLEPNTSKIGFTVLNWHLAHWGFAYNDGKLLTPTTRDMGFAEIPRDDFLKRLADALKLPAHSGRWQTEADLATVADWQPQKDPRPAA